MLFTSYNLLFAQFQAGDVTRILGVPGFENIRAYPRGNTLVVSYENNVYRNKAKALRVVLDNLAGCGYDTLKVVTLVNDLPIVITKLSSYTWQHYKTGETTAIGTAHQIDVSYHTDAAWKLIRDTTPANPQVNKVDLVVYPQVSVMNVRFNRIYEVQFNIAPALEVSLWRGMLFTGQVIFPVVNDHQYGDEGDQIRAGFVTLAQEFRLPGTILGRAVIGKFNQDRYGTDMTLTRYFFGGKYYLSANAGYTGSYEYYGNGWYRNDLKTLTWFLKSGYFYRPYNVQFDVTAGRYLNGDYGVRGDCTRYWGETAIGFYVKEAGGKINGGFHFAIPLYPRRYKKNRHFQLRSPYYFDWEYNAATESYHGQYYETRPNENRAEHFFNPDLLIENLMK
jgi:hypothetical protein